MLVVVGLSLTVAGLCLGLLGKLPGGNRLGRLPGDLRVETEHFQFYFPWVTCLLLSGLLTLGARLFGRFR